MFHPGLCFLSLHYIYLNYYIGKLTETIMTQMVNTENRREKVTGDLEIEEVNHKSREKRTISFSFENARSCYIPNDDTEDVDLWVFCLLSSGESLELVCIYNDA